MRNELTLRRPDFRPGTPIRLADGQAWTFPAPTALEPINEGRASNQRLSHDEAEYDALLAGVLEAEDVPERLRAELALAIHLLGRNYDLDPADFSRVLEFPPGDPDLAARQHDFHNLAVDHLGRHSRRSPSLPVRWAWARIFPRSKAMFDRDEVFAR